jgi:glycosyltransferase involved in cell wall biosynthesis
MAEAPPLLSLLSVVIPARNEQDCIASTVDHLHSELRRRNVPHEIVVVDDASSDATWTKVSDLTTTISELRAFKNRRSRIWHSHHPWTRDDERRRSCDHDGG